MNGMRRGVKNEKIFARVRCGKVRKIMAGK
jgi:hypothetical protein